MVSSVLRKVRPYAESPSWPFFPSAPRALMRALLKLARFSALIQCRCVAVLFPAPAQKGARGAFRFAVSAHDSLLYVFTIITLFFTDCRRFDSL